MYLSHPTHHLIHPCRPRGEACPPCQGVVLYGRGFRTGLSFSDEYGAAGVRQHHETPVTLLLLLCRLPGVASHQRSHPSIHLPYPYLPSWPSTMRIVLARFDLGSRSVASWSSAAITPGGWCLSGIRSAVPKFLLRGEDWGVVAPEPNSYHNGSGSGTQPHQLAQR